MNDKDFILENTAEKIINDISRAVYDFKKQNIHPDEIRILMPSYVKIMLQQYNQAKLSYMFSNVSAPAHIDGIEILPHYKNEIVIYFTEYLPYKSYLEPKIFEL